MAHRAMVAALLAAAACDVPESAPPAERACAGLVCRDAQELDGAGCACLCGGEACAEGERCLATPDGPACQGPCERGMTRLDDGSCACGDGPACDEGVLCRDGACDVPDPCAGVVCDGAARCDPGTRACLCGDEVCDQDVECRLAAGEPVCWVDDCSGIECPEGTFCNAGDGTCHCGSATGPVCSSAQSCREGVCEPGDVCEELACLGEGMICDPEVNHCRCGGIGPEFPLCWSDRWCAHDGTRWFCGGAECRGVDCSAVPGSSCDPEDGICKCGGLGGVLCGIGEGCSVDGDGNDVCAKRCHPLGSDCEGGLACSYDSFTKVALCLAPGDTGPGGTCRTSRDCVAGSYCGKRDGETICVELCDAAAPAGEPTGCPEGESCSKLHSAPADLAGLGFCIAPL